MQTKTSTQWMSIGDLAQRSHVSVATLRFYEQKKLIWSVRTSGNQRRYQRAMLRRIAIVKVAQQVGMTLSDIQDAFSTLPKDKVASKADWQRLSKKWQSDLDQKIITLLELRNQLDWCIGCGCLSQQACPLRNPQDKCAEESTRATFGKLLMNIDILKVSADGTAD